MNKQILFTSFFILCISIISFAQDMIPNHSFEEWDGSPVGWADPLAGTGINNVLPSDDAQDGDASVLFKIVYDDLTGTYPPAGINSAGFDVTEQHNSLDGFYKGTSESDDFLTILVYLYTDNEVIASGSFITMDDQSDWTPFSLDLNYLAPGTPDSAMINIAVGGGAGFGHEGTEFYVDNLNWDNLFGIDDLQEVQSLTLSPNPAINHLEVNFTLPGPDRIAFEIISTSGQVHSISTASEYRAGENTLKVSTADLAPGIYIIRAQGESFTFIRKFVVGR